MRQVDEAELVWKLRYQLGRLSASLRNGLASREPGARRAAEHQVALHLAREGLKRLEILSDTPAGLHGDALYSRAAYGEGEFPVITDDGAASEAGQ